MKRKQLLAEYILSSSVPSVFGIHSALLQVLVGSGHLEVEVLSELLLLVRAAVDGLVGPVERLAGQGLAGVLLLDQLGRLLPPQFSLGSLLTEAGRLPLPRGRDHGRGLGDLGAVPGLGAGAGGRGGGHRVPGQRRKTSSEVTRGGAGALTHQDPVIGAGVAGGDLRSGSSLGSRGLLSLAPDVA